MKTFLVLILLTLLFPGSDAYAGKKPKRDETLLTLTNDGNALKFVPARLQVKAGKPFVLLFKNTAGSKTFIEHNWVVVKPGSENKILETGGAAGSAKGWIPDSPDVLLKAFPLSPGNSNTLTFKAPDQPGDYPFLSTVPNQQNMRGVLHVIP